MPRVALLILIACLASGAAIAQPADAPRVYDIPAMPLKQALRRFARESDISIAYDNLSFGSARSRYLYGRMNSMEALKALLSGSQFDFEFVGVDAVRVIPRVSPLIASDGRFPSASDIILVTATKRRAYLQKIPGSVASVDGMSLHEWGVRDFNAMAPAVAGVSYTNLGPSRDKIFLRGVSDGSFADRTQMTVGVYLDETPIIFNDTNPDLRLVDIDRVEVLRGPQGSLYGSGSIGGIVRIVTNKPDLDNFLARVGTDISATQDGSPNQFFDGVVNAPITPGRLALRAAAYYEKDLGYIDDVNLKIDDVNRSAVYGGRVGLRAKLADRWTIDLAGAAQNVNLDDTQYVFSSLKGLSRANFRREPYADKFRQASLTLVGDLAGAEITSSTAYVHRDIDSVFDATRALGGLIGDPAARGIYQTRDAIRTFNHETRIVSQGEDRFKWLAGLFFSVRRENLGSDLVVDSTDPPSTPFSSDREDHIRETAIFGESSYELAKDVTLTAGMRLSNTRYSADIDSIGSINTAPPNFRDSRTHTVATPKFSIAYQANENLLIYALAARGSRIGGFNVNSPLAALGPRDADESTLVFEPDGLWSSEIGLKSTWFGGDLTLNAAGFYIRWSNIQSDQILPTGFSFIANAGRARNFGFESELKARPLSWLEIASALTVNDPELMQANAFLGAHRGDALPNIASVSASFSAAADFPLPASWSGRVSIDYHAIGRSYLTFAQTQSPRMGDYSVANLRVTASRGRALFGFYAHNLLNERGNTFAFGNPFSLSSEPQGTPVRPRTVGVFVEFEY